MAACSGPRGRSGSPTAQYLLWSDIPNNRDAALVPRACGVRVFRQPSNNTNGHTRDREGRLVSCEHGGRRVSPHRA